VRTAPVFGAGWSGAPPDTQTLIVSEGQTVTQHLHLPAGTFEVSLPYQSQVPLTVTSSTGQTFHLPPYLGAYAPIWRVGDVSTDGRPVALSVTVGRPPVQIVPRTAILGAIVAAPASGRDRTIPLAQACGRYVDWYREA
jgi:hypothetical protein